jgi:hypothetical protein
LGSAIFEGYAEDDLAIEIAGTEKELFDPDESMGRYVRTFSCDAERWFGSYGPGDEAIDPEDIGVWKVWYRIERS